tara:strand:+ start:430 stop:747 length:318 start_codon:yes stop_codon:yes gene_type:complete
MFKKYKYILLLSIFLLNSCAGDFDSVKRGLTGAKEKSSDEFLVEKKDPLILPPDFDRLPTPEAGFTVEDSTTDFEKTLKENMPKEDISTAASSAEESILKRIKNK